MAASPFIGKLLSAHGASEEEITKALGVPIAVNAGASLLYSTRVMDAIKITRTRERDEARLKAKAICWLTR